jgi:peptidoglycan-associated lipoprotein
MKLVKLAAILLAISWLAGCSSLGSGKKGTDATDGSDVIVEDLNAQSSGVNGENVSGTDLDGSEARVIVGEGSELNDPSSPLSSRVVYFEYDSSSVRAEDQATLTAHAAYLGTHPNVTIRLVGHTDERGAREYNLALGERRALAIRQILMLQGASLEQFQVASFGEERPAAEGHDESAWSQNRRVELVYVGR